MGTRARQRAGCWPRVANLRLNQQPACPGSDATKPRLTLNRTYVRQVLDDSLTTSRQATVFGGAKRRRLPANRQTDQGLCR